MSLAFKPWSRFVSARGLILAKITTRTLQETSPDISYEIRREVAYVISWQGMRRLQPEACF